VTTESQRWARHDGVLTDNGSGNCHDAHGGNVSSHAPREHTPHGHWADGRAILEAERRAQRQVCTHDVGGAECNTVRASLLDRMD
jgi:hypothetical protein